VLKAEATKLLKYEKKYGQNQHQQNMPKIIKNQK